MAQRYLCRDCGFRFSEKSYKDFLLTKNSQLCAKLEAKKLDSATEIKTVAGEDSLSLKGNLVQFTLYMQKEGLADSTVVAFNRILKRLSRVSNLANSESVKEALTKENIQKNTKVTYCVAYQTFLKFIGKTWNPPKYKYRQKLPEFLPSEEELNALIAGAGPHTAPLLQSIMETGMRLNECLSLTWLCVNFQNAVITLPEAEKHSLPRVFKVSPKLLNMQEHCQE